MAQANIIAWNLGGYSTTEHLATKLEYAQFLATVILKAGADLVGFCGILDARASSLGRALVKELNNRAQADKWREQASPQLGLSRGEQYSFVWNSEKFTPAKTTLTDYFQYDYRLPDESRALFGFPRAHNQSNDLPPFLGCFGLVGTSKILPVAVFHAPDWSESNGFVTRLACDVIPYVPEFRQGDGLLLMGTFNVPKNDDVNAADSNGAMAFGKLAGASGPFTQLLNNQPTLLAEHALVAMTMEEALVQTADNFFFRKAANGLTASGARVLNVFDDVFGSFDAQQQWQTAPLGPALSELQAAVGEVGDDTGSDDEDEEDEMMMTAEPDGSYAKLEDAFAPYRALVSAYMPLLVTVNY